MLELKVDEFLASLLSIVQPLAPIDLPLLDAHGAVLASDLHFGERLLLKEGSPIRSNVIGLAASLGLGHLKTRPQPRVVVLSAGPDLVEPGQRIRGSEEYEINSWQLTTLVREIGGVGFRVHSIPDDELELRSVIEDQLVRADLIVVAGEQHDDSFELISGALSSLGTITKVQLEINRSGKYNFGQIGPDKTPVITLPGDAISAYISMQLFVRPVIRTMLGSKEIFCPSIKVQLERDFNQTIEIKSYLLAQTSEDNRSAMVLPDQNDFATLAIANSLVAVNKSEKLKAGDYVTSVILPRIK